MKALHWIFPASISILLFASCNIDGNDDKPSYIKPNGEIRVKDESDSRFAKLDADQDEGITQAEFDAVFEDETFDDWDVNGDKLLDFEEFRDGVFDLHDEDHNSSLTESERNTIFDDKPGADIADWDRDGNEEMDREEFRQIFSMKTKFSDWDENENGNLDKHEYNRRMYRMMDKNDDGIISRTEFDNVGTN